MKCEIIKTNIVNVSADAIVLPANTALLEGSGASTAIFEAAGRKQLTQACKIIGSCKVGSAVPTLAFNLRAKYIIHAVVPRWIDGSSGEYELLSSAYLTALSIADVMGCSSIAFPVLASGNNRFDKHLALQIAKESFETFEGNNLRKVILVIFDEATTSIIKDQGYDVAEIPYNLQKEEQQLARKAKARGIVECGKEIALNFFEDQLQNGLNFLKDPNNQEYIIALAKVIVDGAIQHVMARASKEN